jgi:hypothetical protein
MLKPGAGTFVDPNTPEIDKPIYTLAETDFFVRTERKITGCPKRCRMSKFRGRRPEKDGSTPEEFYHKDTMTTQEWR